MSQLQQQQLMLAETQASPSYDNTDFDHNIYGMRRSSVSFILRDQVNLLTELKDLERFKNQG